MQARGIEMIDEIQGPPRWDGPDVLLRQTSFRALAEPRTFRDADGTALAGGAAGQVRRGRGPRHRAHPGRAGPLRRAGRRGGPPPGRRPGPAVAPTWHRRCGARGCPPPSATCAWPGSASSRSGSTRRRRRAPDAGAAGPRWSMGTSPGSSGRASCTPSRSSTRTSCRARRPASSPRTSRTAGPWTRSRAGPSATPAGWRTSWGATVNVPEEIYAQEASASLRAAEQVLGRLIRTG